MRNNNIGEISFIRGGELLEGLSIDVLSSIESLFSGWMNLCLLALECLTGQCSIP
jgi:hypothetical protein